jgi:NAD+ synthase
MPKSGKSERGSKSGPTLRTGRKVCLKKAAKVSLPEIDCEDITRQCVQFIRKEVARAGVSGAVVGLSGGLDSAVVATLCVRALSPQKVTALIMPYKTSSHDSISDAESLASKLAVETRKVEITPMIDAYFAIHQGADIIRRGNKMARERMAILYDYSKTLHALVVGTGNKTEYLLGYFTIFGDGAYAINPIGDLYKTEAYQLARYLGVPRKIIQKKPSADLWKGQTDEGELGFAYEEVDKILYSIFDCGRNEKQLIAQGFCAEMIGRILAKIASTEFKRRPPKILSLRKYR